MRVKQLVSSHYEQSRYSLDEADGATADPIIEALTPNDSVLIPHGSISQLIAISSSWLDLASADSIIADVSRQAFNLEIAYAAFCGISQVLVAGPVLPDGTISYSICQSHLGRTMYFTLYAYACSPTDGTNQIEGIHTHFNSPRRRRCPSL